MEDYLKEEKSKEERIISLISSYGYIDGAHHKQWVLDQTIRIAMGCPVENKTLKHPDGDYSYLGMGKNKRYTDWASGSADVSPWDEGIAP